MHTWGSPREEGREHQAGLTEHDCEEDRVRGAPVLLNDHAHVLVQVQHPADERCVSVCVSA